MRTIYLVLCLSLIGSGAHSADKVLILNEEQQAAFRQIADAAIRAGGLSPMSRNAFVLSDMLDRAPVMTGQKEVKPQEAKPEEPKPPEPTKEPQP